MCICVYTFYKMIEGERSASNGHGARRRFYM